ncbi:hypothetical protein MKW94_003346 [Papaver nudicaule]|uniref:Uncharacterized protein n=1 Tax=Papaver nudicaule TaxID=74823 RepID=A0AA41V5U0_PAPNU|nr:hypothetical protein [Papaver nudicaule]
MDGPVKSTLYKSISIDDQELLGCRRKNYIDIESTDRSTKAGGERMFGIDGVVDINESAEAFIQNFRHNREPPRVYPKINNVQRKPSTAVGNKPIEHKDSVEDINESADAFIKRFKKQLLIQRLESIENYQNLLARGL